MTGVRDNLSVAGIPELGHLDETPYEHDHADYESRFIDYDVVPHHESGYDSHGIQDVGTTEATRRHLGDDAHTHTRPDEATYDELLWAYQHGRQDHVDHHALFAGEEVVHHEDRPYYESPYSTTEHVEAGYELPLFQPDLA